MDKLHRITVQGRDDPCGRTARSTQGSGGTPTPSGCTPPKTRHHAVVKVEVTTVGGLQVAAYADADFEGR